VIERLAPGVHAEWDELVARTPGSTVHHLSGWSAVASRAYGFETALLASRAAPGAPLRGVLPLFVVPRPLQRYVTTGLFGAYGPILADAAARDELLAAARAFTDRARARFLHVKALGHEPAPPGFARQDLWVRAVLPLAPDPARVWKRLRKSIRAAVRQAERAGLSLRFGHEGLDGFYDVLAENMHRKGTPIYGRELMRAILDVFGDRALVATVHAGDLVVGGALTMELEGVVTVPFASSRPAWLPKRPNDLLYWRIIERACARGLRALDYGWSLRGTTALDFKLHWGAVTEPVASYVYTPEKAAPPPVLGPSSPAVQAGVELWRRLPRGVADRLGPYLCRYFA
jgi:FemAB-related protein (PEP-CTERM system-associated)